jgi:hypothetical protein
MKADALGSAAVREGTYLVRVELRDDPRVLLDVADSPRFAALRGKAACGGP